MDLVGYSEFTCRRPLPPLKLTRPFTVSCDAGVAAHLEIHTETESGSTSKRTCFWTFKCQRLISAVSVGCLWAIEKARILVRIHAGMRNAGYNATRISKPLLGNIRCKCDEHSAAPTRSTLEPPNSRSDLHLPILEAVRKNCSFC
jgi:hypothetical protein